MARTNRRKPGRSGYDVFISYCHGHDRSLAAALESHLESYAKPWYRLRSVHVCRDESSLQANPDLWESIKAKLSATEHLILLASTASAQSKWVGKELCFWITGGQCEIPYELEKHQTKQDRVDRILIVLTNGQIMWDEATDDFDWSTSTSVHRVLSQVFKGMPAFVKLTSENSDCDLKWDRSNDQFMTAVAKLSAPICGLDLEKLVRKDYFEQKRRIRHFTWLSTLLAICFASAVCFAAWVWWQKSYVDLANQKLLAGFLAASSRSEIGTSWDDLQKSTLLALESLKRQATLDGDQALRASLALLPAPPRLLNLEHRVTSLWADPDGELLLCGTDAGIVYSWNVARDEISESIHTELAIRHLAASNGANFIAVGGGYRSVKVYSKGSNRVYCELPDHGDVYQLLLSRDARTIMTASSEGLFYWDISSIHLRIPDQPFTPMPSFLVNVPHPPLARIAMHRNSQGFALAQGQFLAQGAIGSGGRPTSRHLPVLVNDMAYTPGSLLVATDNALLSDGKPIVRGNFERVLATKSRIATQSGHTLRLWNWINESTISECTRIGIDENIVAFGLGAKEASPWLAVLTEDGKVRIWRIGEGSRHFRVESDGSHARAISVAISPDGKALAVGSDYFPRLYDLTNGTKTATLLPDAESKEDGPRRVAKLSALAFSADGKWLFTGGEFSGQILVWDLGSKRVLKAIKKEEQEIWNDVMCMSLSADGKYLAAGCNAGVVKVWRIDSWTEVMVTKAHSFAVLSVAISPDGRFLATGGRDGAAKVLDVKSGETVIGPIEHATNCDISSVSFSSSGKSLLVGSTNGTCSLWDIATRKETRRDFFGEPVANVQFCPVGDHELCAIASGSTVRLFSADSWETIQVWQTTTPSSSSVQITDFAYDPKKQWIAIATDDGIASVWPIDAAPLARQRLTRHELTPDERRRFLLDVGASNR